MKAFRTISSLLLALLVLFSSTSFTVAMHICMGDIQTMALSPAAQSCEMEKELPPCHRAMAEPCCEDETLVHEADLFKTTGHSFDLTTNFIAAEMPAVVLSFLVPEYSTARFLPVDYDPPLRSSDLTILHRVFLI